MTMRQSEPIGTGQEIALAMARHFPGQDWVAELAERSGRSRDTVEWHLQQEMTPPAEIGEARLLGGQGWQPLGWPESGLVRRPLDIDFGPGSVKRSRRRR